MLRHTEAFSFDIKTLNTETGEQNFEMIRAELWLKKQRPPEDRAFDALVSLVTDPCEVCFEMIHMVQYAKKRVHPSVFDAWQPSHLFAEFWFQRQAELAVTATDSRDKKLTQPMIRQVVHQSIQVDSSNCFVHEVAPTVTREETIVENSPVIEGRHRALPGFRSILQCGSNTMYGDSTLMGSMTVASTTITPTTARINRLFQESTLGFTQYQNMEPNHNSETISSLENARATDRINRVFQETTNSAEFPNSISVAKGRLDDVENEPPLVTSDKSEEMKMKSAVKYSTNIERRNFLQGVSENAQHQETSNASGQHVASQVQTNFSIFYDPLGLETSAQPSSVVESSANLPNNRPALLPKPTPDMKPSPTPTVTRPVEVLISSRDPRLRAKQVLGNSEPVASPGTGSGSLPSGNLLFEWLEKNRNIPTATKADADESIIGARNSLAMQSPTTFFRCFSNRNRDDPK